MAINGCRKGKAGEREVVNLLQPAINERRAAQGWPLVDMKRNLVQSRSGGCDIIGLPGWAPEVKRVAKVTPGFLDKAWQQACRQAAEMADQQSAELGHRVGIRPVLIYRGNQQTWRARLWVKAESKWIPADIGIPDLIEVICSTL